MKIKLNQIYRAEPVLRKLTGQEMPIKIAYRIQKAIHNVQEEYARIEKLRMELVQKYGEEKEQKMQVKQENVMQFAKEFAELLEEDVDLKCERLDIDALPDSIQMTVQDLENLGFLIKPNKEHD